MGQHTSDGVQYDVGGQWVGPTQKRLLDLILDFECVSPLPTSSSALVLLERPLTPIRKSRVDTPARKRHHGVGQVWKNQRDP